MEIDLVLEEAARRYAALQAGMKDAMTSEFYEEYPYSPNDVNAFKAGAQWQEHRDSSLYENTKKMWEEIDKQYDDGFATGQKLLREQMLKHAKSTTVYHRPNDFGEYDPHVCVRVSTDFQENEKVKVIIIKED